MAIPPSPAIAHVTTCRDDGAAGSARAQTMGGQQMIETPAAKRIGDAVRQLLAESSMSKARFAQQAEMSREQLTRIIKGEVSSPPGRHTAQDRPGGRPRQRGARRHPRRTRPPGTARRQQRRRRRGPSATPRPSRATRRRDRRDAPRLYAAAWRRARSRSSLRSFSIWSTVASRASMRFSIWRRV